MYFKKVKRLIKKLKKIKVLDERTERAFLKIDRRDFLPEECKHLAEEDRPIPIGCGQTNSQPTVVAFMLNKLNPQKGDLVLDIGSGSGWTTALLAELVGSKGKVVAIERIKELKIFGEENVRKYGFIEEGRVNFVHGDGWEGFPKKAPFDRILVSAGLKEEIPESWKDQLTEGGTVVAPVKNSICKFNKNGGEITKEEFFGFRFVPLIKNNE